MNTFARVPREWYTSEIIKRELNFYPKTYVQ